MIRNHLHEHGLFQEAFYRGWLRNFCRKVVLVLLLSGILFACQKSNNPNRSTETAPRKPSQIAVKVFIDRDGIYSIDSSDLKTAGLQDALINPSQLRLFYKGYAQPLWSLGVGKDRIFLFYAQASDRNDRRENVYWLVLNSNGSIHPVMNVSHGRASTDSAFPLLPANEYIATVHAEENNLYLPQTDSPDHWFWLTLPAPQSHRFVINLDSIGTGPARLRLAVLATTDSPLAQDHHLRVSVNDQPIIDDSWDGKGIRVLSAEFSNSILQEGSNEVLVEAPGIAGVSADIIQIDWLEIDYARSANAIDDRLDFVSNGNSMHFNGFSGSVTLFDVTDPVSPTLDSIAWDPINNFTGKLGHRYIAVGPSGGMQPLRFVPVLTDPDLRSMTMGADYIAIGALDLLEPLKPLLDWRASQGLKVIAVPVQAVYDQFYAGLPEAAAIQAFMKYASSSWKVAPRYLLLVGDSSYDPSGYITPAQANQLPTFLVNTVYGGETASDVGFVQINDDPYPDLAIGHIPARDPNQVKTIVEKTISYEKETIQKNRQVKVLAIADGQDPSFQADAQAFLDRFPSDRFETSAYFPKAGESQAHVKIANDLKQDFTLVAYFGHGSVNMWGKDRLFSSDDVKGLSSAITLPVVFNFTCLTGLFIHPKVESLAETFLWQPNGGAVAVLAPSSLTLPTDQDFLSNELAQLLVEHPEASLGQLQLVARRAMPMDLPGAKDVLQTFMLFGDPALKLAIPVP